MTKTNATPNVVAAAVDAAPSGKTTVAAALADALSDPKRFNGRKVIEREAAVYEHPSPVVKNAATSKLVDRVLLDDGAEVFQCRTCGDVRQVAQSAVVHASSHSRTAAARSATAAHASRAAQEKRAAAAPAPGGDVEAVAAATKKAVAAATKKTTKQAAKSADSTTTRTGKTVIKADVHEIVSNLNALAVQQERQSASLKALATEVLNVAQRLEDETKPAIAPEELAELRAKAQKFDTLTNLLNQ